MEEKIVVESTRKKLEGKVALVTGASGNLGRAVAEALGTMGASVALHHHDPRKEADMEAVAADLRARGSRAFVARADLRRVPEVEAPFGGRPRSWAAWTSS